MTDNTLQDLLPCPFCGAEPEDRWDDDELDFVHCSNEDCDLRGAEITREYWNTRAQPAPAAGVEEADPWGDRPDEYTKDIQAAHPMKTGDHATYCKAASMVGNRHSKYALVDLVNWLLTKSALPAPSISEDEAVEIMAGAMRSTQNPDMGGKKTPDAYDYMARRAYRALIAAGVIRGV